MKNLIAQENIFGNVLPPTGVSGDVSGLPTFVNSIIKTLIAGAGLYALFNLVLAGYAFMSAGDDAKKVAGAWAKIWQTLLGLAIAAGSFVLAAIFGKIIFNDYNALLQFKVFVPTP